MLLELHLATPYLSLAWPSSKNSWGALLFIFAQDQETKGPTQGLCICGEIHLGKLFNGTEPMLLFDEVCILITASWRGLSYQV